MSRTKTALYWALLLLGVLLVLAAIFVLDGVAPKAVGGVCIGGGCALFSVALNKLVMQRMMEKNPQWKRKAMIDERDERNVAINSRAKARAFDAISPAFGAVVLIQILLDVSLIATLALVGAYVAVYAVYFASMSKYNKEM